MDAAAPDDFRAPRTGRALPQRGHDSPDPVAPHTASVGEACSRSAAVCQARGGVKSGGWVSPPNRLFRSATSGASTGSAAAACHQPSQSSSPSGRTGCTWWARRSRASINCPPPSGPWDRRCRPLLPPGSGPPGRRRRGAGPALPASAASWRSAPRRNHRPEALWPSSFAPGLLIGQQHSSARPARQPLPEGPASAGQTLNGGCRTR